MRLGLPVLAALTTLLVGTSRPATTSFGFQSSGRLYELVRIDSINLTGRVSGCGLRASWLRFPGGSTWLVTDSLVPCPVGGVAAFQSRVDSGVFGFEGPTGADSIILFRDIGNDRVPTWFGRFGYEVMVLRHQIDGTIREYVHRPSSR
jgi:hypothetical protein